MKIVDFEEKEVFGLKVEGNTQETMPKMPGLWGKFLELIKDDLPNLKETFGLCYSPKHTMDEFVYVACSSVEKEGMVKDTIKAGRYAVFEHVGPAKEIGQTYEKAMKTVAENNESLTDDFYCFELYDERFKDDEESVCEIYIKLK
jgi:AraC family transcriptional regulator